MTEDDKARLIALAHLPLASLSLVDIGFLMRIMAEHEEEAFALVPELGALAEL